MRVYMCVYMCVYIYVCVCYTIHTIYDIVMFLNGYDSFL